MKMVVLGAGMQGTACAYDLLQNPAVEQVILADVSLEKAQQSAQRLASPKVTAQQMDVQDSQALVALLQQADVAVSAVPYFLNLQVTQAAIGAQTHLVDMGGNTDVVFQQRALDGQAKAAGVTILPDAGLAPGLANLLAVNGIEQLDEVDAVHIRVGGLPQFPQPPLNYQLFFSMHGLINEYVGRAVILRDGKVTEVETLTEVELLSFRDPIGECEAFHTLGGLSTLPWTYEGRISTMDYKTIRYPGHGAQIRAMVELGLLDETPVSVNGTTIRPRDVFAAVTTPRLVGCDPRDVVLVRVVVEGEKRGEALRLTYEIVDFYDESTQLTAMMRTTAFPVSILAQMLGDGTLTQRGVLPLETTVPTQRFLQEVQKRGISVSVDALPLHEKHAHAH